MFVCAETKYEWQSKGGGRSGGVFNVSETTDGLFETLQKPERWDHPAASSITVGLTVRSRAPGLQGSTIFLKFYWQ